MTEFTPISATIGGIMIGASAVMLMAVHGRIAGISGILSGILRFEKGEWAWRLAFILGLIGSPLLIEGFSAYQIPHFEPGNMTMMAIGGLIVGFGTTMGGGCTSGHGVCGMSRGSARSFTAVAVFMIVGMATVYITRHVLGWGA